MILTPLQKLLNYVGNTGKIIVATCFEQLPKVQKIAQSGHTAQIPKVFYAKEVPIGKGINRQRNVPMEEIAKIK